MPTHDHGFCSVCQAFIPKTLRNYLLALNLYLENQRLRCLAREAMEGSASASEPTVMRKVNKARPESSLAAPTSSNMPLEVDENLAVRPEVGFAPSVGTRMEAIRCVDPSTSKAMQTSSSNDLRNCGLLLQKTVSSSLSKELFEVRPTSGISP